MLNDKLLELIPTYFKNQSILTKEELACAIRKHFPGWSDATINVRISELKKEDAVQNPSRGIYTIKQKPDYIPEISPNLRKLYNSLILHLPYAQFCVWDTKWLNEFMRHQPVRFYLIAEVEKEVMESAYHGLSESFKHVFLDPDTAVYERYIHKSEYPLIIKPMISESPTTTKNKVIIPKIEKVLVDMLSDTDLFGAQQFEIDSIYRIVRDKYKINQGMMKRYARRRNREKELSSILNKTMANDG